MSERTPNEESTHIATGGSTGSEDTGRIIGRKIGNYQVVSVLGRGGFGAVYEAEDEKLHRRVALKFIHQSANDFHSHMFEREAKALASLSKHPNIVQIHSWDEFEGENYFVLEYVESSAAELLRKFPHGVPVNLAVRIMAECADALAFAHKSGVLHRDIKSANILIESGTGAAKVADFGLARIRGASAHTIEGSAIGSPLFMAPEQIRGEELSHLCDIYSLGVTLYHLLCGQTPVIGNSHLEIMEKVRNNQGVPIQEQLPELPKALAAIVEKAMAHDPHKRYQTAAELAEALRSFSIADPAPVRPRRVPIAWRFGIAAALALVLAVAAVALAGRSSEGTAETAGAGTADLGAGTAIDSKIEPSGETAAVDENDLTVEPDPADEATAEAPAETATVQPSAQPQEPNIKKRFKNAFRRNEK